MQERTIIAERPIFINHGMGSGWDESDVITSIPAMKAILRGAGVKCSIKTMNIGFDGDEERYPSSFLVCDGGVEFIAKNILRGYKTGVEEFYGSKAEDYMPQFGIGMTVIDVDEDGDGEFRDVRMETDYGSLDTLKMVELREKGD